MNKKILIRVPNHLGDCVMAMPMISETREAFPGSTVALLAPENLAELFKGNPSIDDLIFIPKEYVHGLVGVMKIHELISKNGFNLGIILPPSFGSAAAFKLAGIDERIGYIADGRRLLLTKPIPLPEPRNSEHRSILYYNLLRRATNVDLEYLKPNIYADDIFTNRVQEILSGHNIDSEHSIITIAFRAVAESRRWGMENYSEIAKYLVHEKNMTVVLTGTEADREEGDKIVSAVKHKNICNLSGKTSIKELISLLSISQLFIGNDSGSAHLAGAVGVPLIVLSGADDPKETSPMSDNKIILYRDELDCISCVKNVCPLKGDEKNQCMKKITIDDVKSSIESILSNN